MTWICIISGLLDYNLLNVLSGRPRVYCPGYLDKFNQWNTGYVCPLPGGGGPWSRAACCARERAAQRDCACCCDPPDQQGDWATTSQPKLLQGGTSLGLVTPSRAVPRGDFTRAELFHNYSR